MRKHLGSVIAGALIWIANQLLLKERDAFISKKDIEKVVFEWKVVEISKLYELSLSRRKKPIGSMAFSQEDIRTILPSYDDLEEMVDVVTNRFRRHIDDCVMQSDLQLLLTYLNQGIAEIRADVLKRNSTFDECVRQWNSSIQFLGRMRVLHADMTNWRVLPIEHNIQSEEFLMGHLSEIFMNWEAFEQMKNAHALLVFYDEIKVRETIAKKVIKDIIPYYGDTDRDYDPKSLMAGIVLGSRLMPCAAAA